MTDPLDKIASRLGALVGLLWLSLMLQGAALGIAIGTLLAR